MNPTQAAAILFGGAGLVVAWFAVPPGHAPGSVTDPTMAERQRTELVAASLRVETDRLRTVVDSETAPTPPSRNPFRFEVPRPARVTRLVPLPAIELPPAPVRPPVPVLSLVGIAENATPEGPSRTAVVSGMGQLFLVKEGEQFGGMFRVLRVGTESLELLNTRDNVTIRMALK